MHAEHSVTTDRLVVLAGGVSSRMRRSLAERGGVEMPAEGTAVVKTMLSVRGRPFLDLLLAFASAGGIRDVTIVTGTDDGGLRAHIRAHAHEHPYRDLAVSYAVQRIPPGSTAPEGTADALLCALRVRTDWAGGAFLVCNGDNLYSPRAFAALREVPGGACADYDAGGLSFPDERLGAFGTLRTDADGYLLDIVEKPGAAAIRAARSRGERVGVSMNLWRFEYDAVLPCLVACPRSPERGEKELPRAVAAMIAGQPRSIRAVPLRERVPDLTTIGDLDDVAAWIGAASPWERP